MIGFHIDMNVVQFRGDYLQKWLKQLAGMGYDTIIWEVENNIQWETCPECVSPDAFSKEEFKELLDYADSLGLEAIPLLQVIGHCEYVLKHDIYKHLAELDDNISQYCPLKPEVIKFLCQWIEEYLELFQGIKYFNIGADEAMSLGKCDACSKFSEEHSKSELYVNHVNAMAKPILERNITPIIWCDMILHHIDALEKLSREIMVFDWMYDIYRGNGRIWTWGGGERDANSITPEEMTLFGNFIFPEGNEPGAIPETFYTADFLAVKGFKTVTCPGSSSYGDNVFSPRNLLHLRNTFDSMIKGLSPHLSGAVLTSWSVHLFPWELQLACLAVPEFIKKQPEGSIADYQSWFTEKYFGLTDGTDFWKACGLLSKSCIFTHTSSLGFDKSCLPVPLQHINDQIKKFKKEKQLDGLLNNCQAQLAEYRQAAEIFAQIKVNRNHELIDIWKLAAENLINRARASIFLIAQALGDKVEIAEGQNILNELKNLKLRTDEMYQDMVKNSRRKEMISWIFDSMEHCLEEACN